MEQIATCQICQEQTRYYELECDEPFTAPAPLAWKALTIWGVYGADKELLHQYNNMVHFRLGSETRLVKMLGWDEEKWQRSQEEAAEKREPCEQEGCTKQGYPCFTLFEPDAPIGYYCVEHMNQNGVCPGCHRFMAGFESFDFSPTGYCDSCSEALDDGIDDSDEWDDDYSIEDEYLDAQSEPRVLG